MLVWGGRGTCNWWSSVWAEVVKQQIHISWEMGAAWLWLPRWPWSKRDLLGREALLRQLNLISHSPMEDYFKDLKLSSTVTSPLEWGSLFWLMQNCLLLTGVCILLKCLWHVREALWAPSAPVRPGSLFGLPAQIRHAEGWKLSQVFATLCIFEWKQVPFLDDLEVTHTCLIPSPAGQWHRCYRLWCWILPFGPWFSLVHAMQNGELSCGMFCSQWLLRKMPGIADILPV